MESILPRFSSFIVSKDDWKMILKFFYSFKVYFMAELS